MKKIFGILLVLLTVNSNGQDDKNSKPAGHIKQQLYKLNQQAKSDLNLNESQTKQWDEIHKSYGEKLRSLRSDESLSNPAKKEKAKNLFKEMNEEILVILDDSQKKEYTELVAQNRKIAKDYRQNKQKENSGQKVKEALNLTDDQSEKWQGINTEYRKKMQNLRKDTDISDADRKEKIANLWGEKNAEILAILDADQQAKYMQLVDERKTNGKANKSNSGY